MIIEETINDMLFQEQRSYYVYKSEKDRTDGNWALFTSDEDEFLQNKELARHNKKKHENLKVHNPGFDGGPYNERTT